MMYGAPGHRIESQLSACAASLGIRAQFIHIPAIVIACFGDPEVSLSPDPCAVFEMVVMTRHTLPKRILSKQTAA